MTTDPLATVFGPAAGDNGRDHQPEIPVSRFSLEGNEKQPTGPSFQFTPLAELLSEPPEAVAWTVEGLLPTGGISVLAGKPKTGKSTLARVLALSVASGRPFLDRACQPGPVLYLAHEDKRSELREHFHALGATNEPLLVHAGRAPLDTDAAIAELAGLIRERGAVLVVVDTLMRLVRLPDANDYARVNLALEPLCHLARETGAHLLLVHHAGKAEREGGDAVLGSTAFFGAVDTALILRRRSDGARIIESRQRYGADLPATVLRLDPESRSVESAGGVVENDDAKRQQAIIDALAGGHLTESEIREAVGGDSRVVRQTLHGLIHDGRIERSGSGTRGSPFRYSILDAPMRESRIENPDDGPPQPTDTDAEAAFGGQDGDGELFDGADPDDGPTDSTAWARH
ncbi:MAG: AAA family ATPase [Phycisphaerae bacterium]